MTEQTKQYIIGIDLGTTNCTLAYAKIPEGGLRQGLPVPEITPMGLPQIVAAGTQDACLQLPSFLYFPLPEEAASKSLGVDWDPSRSHCVGTFSRERGEELPDRLVSSAKSWLCHGGADRRSPILPWMSESVDKKISPVEACTLYLSHLREVWDLAHPDALFAEQEVLVTVPASFDPAARQMVQEAAKEAGYPEVILLEEPQAAFYAWLHRQGEGWRESLEVKDKVLVVDVGGGTTDFSLIEVQDEEGNLQLERLSVGEHLLLGGDNMDLALAYLARQKLEEQGHHLDDWQFQSLMHMSRRAKEALFGEDAPQSIDLTVQGRGSGLVAGSLSVSLDLEEVQGFLIDGFLPLIEKEDLPQSGARTGLEQVGLPYALDARITSQLALFLSTQGERGEPTKVLFNGGALRSPLLRGRLLEQLKAWSDEGEVTELPGPDFDHAVSRGAVYYGLARHGGAVRIKSGTSHSYYIGVEDSVPAIPGMPRPLKAVCVVPFGMEEGTERDLEEREFALVVGEKAAFRFFSLGVPALSSGEEPDVGSVVRSWKKELCELQPLETILDGEESSERMVRVRLRSRVTELGVMELWCVAEGGHKWKLEFDVRETHSAVSCSV